ncbi:MAG TPA: mannose-6-phosphate isomerase, partial [Enterococcus sp.]|nr:mannose-6-phosphate isomerase [Enterococcus sp.]
EVSITEVRHGESAVVTYLKTDFFNVYEWQVKGVLSFTKQAPYTLATVIEGYGKLVVDGEVYELELGTSFILPDQITNWEIQGDVKIIASEPGEK